jgi:hypothetical protein
LYNGWAEHDTYYDAKILGQVDWAITLAPDNLWGYFVNACGFRTVRMRRAGRPMQASPSLHLRWRSDSKEMDRLIPLGKSTRRTRTATTSIPGGFADRTLLLALACGDAWNQKSIVSRFQFGAEITSP